MEILMTEEDLTILRTARERIAAGWCAGELIDDFGGVCLLAALGYFSTETDFYAPCSGAIRALRYLGFRDRIEAFEWNDMQTSSAPVLARLDAAIGRVDA